MDTNLEELSSRLAKFAADRAWEQFHTPKNLTMALAGEAGELVAEMQWMTEAEITDALDNDGGFGARVRAEIGDVLIYLVRLADVLQVDLVDCAVAKLEINETKYPVDQSRGNAVKYSRLGDPQ